MSLSEQDRNAALEHYKKWALEPMDDDGEGESTQACTKRAWLRACEWMQQYSKQAAYVCAARLCAEEYEDSGDVAASILEARILSLAKGETK